MALIDTNILVIAADAEHPRQAAAELLLRHTAEGHEAWFLTWQNVFEFVRTVTHPQAFHKAPMFIDEALKAVRKLMSSPSLQILHPGPRHFEVFSELALHTPGVRGNLVHDARLVAIMHENGVRKIYTADEGMRRFKNIDVVNPIA